MKENIIQYLRTVYQPNSIILYGSYADGTANEYSDFDALLICEQPEKEHDDAVIDGVQLDVFLYTPEQINQLTPEDLLQIYDGHIILDKDDMAAELRKMVRDYVDRSQYPSALEVADNLSWCRKMQKRTLTDDAEGYYRWHWLLTDSLSVYCDVRKWFYFGPKKTLIRMSKEDETGYGFYYMALRYMESEALENWITYLEILFNQRKAADLLQKAEKLLNGSNVSIKEKEDKKDISAEQSLKIYWMRLHNYLRELDHYDYIDDQIEIDEIWNLANEIPAAVHLDEIGEDYKKTILEEIISNYYYDHYGVYDPMHELAYKMCGTDCEKMMLARILEEHNQKTEAAAIYRELDSCDDCIRCMKTGLKDSPEEYLELINYCESLGRHQEAVQIAEQAYQKSRGNGMTDIMLILLDEAIANDDTEMQNKLLKSAKRRSYVDAEAIQNHLKEHI